ncbi:MAG: hypothetical protein AAF236_14730 [Verrucomicrobiota bacterium]
MAMLKGKGRVTFGAIWVSILGLLVIGTGIWFVEVEPEWARWVVSSVAGFCVMVALLWRKVSGETEDEEEQIELVEMARDALRSESKRLETKRRKLEAVVSAYGEWMEFPDFDELQSVDWQAEDRSQGDLRVADLIDEEADRVFLAFSSGDYWREGNFETRQLVLDLFSFVEKIACVYQPDAKRPVLEMNLENLLKAINRASLQIILLLEGVPVLKLHEMNLRTLSDRIRLASKGYRTYKKMQPYIDVGRYLFQGGKMLLASNPLIAAGVIAGSELAVRGGKEMGKRMANAYFLSTLREALGIIAWETAGVYDRTHRYRSSDWIFGVELAHLLSQFDATQEVLRESFKALGALPLRSSYDRIFLYRCIAHNVSPKPHQFAQPDLLSEEKREQIFTDLLAFYEKHIADDPEVQSKATQKWRDGLAERLGLGADD